MKLSNVPNKCNLGSVCQYYSKLIIGKPFHLSDTSGDEVFSIMQNIDFLKAASIGNLSEIFFKDGVKILAKLIIEICNLSITSRTFLDVSEVAKLKPISKKSKKTDLSNYRPTSFLPLISKILERIIHDQANGFL